MASESAEITKEFLEAALKSPIDKFVVDTGSELGDGYTCVLYSVDVWLAGNNEPLALLIKCFPSNPARQQLLEVSGIFGVELKMYDTVIPDLQKFQRDTLGKTEFRLPFAPFYAGDEVVTNEKGGPKKPLDGYLIMADLRKKGGFRLRDRFEGLDFDHFKLVIESQAILHAVSWAFKQTKGKNLREMYPFLTAENLMKIMEDNVSENLKLLDAEIESFKDDSKIYEGLKYLRSVTEPLGAVYFGYSVKNSGHGYTKDTILRKPGVAIPNEEPWEVLSHGDCWSNNLLFRYDPITGKPVEVVFIDLQTSDESDMFFDICYSFFLNTPQDVRRKHKESLLRIYYDTFTEVCQRFEVRPLPGWSWEEFNRRFHRAQIYGMSSAAGELPIMLQDPEEAKDLENLDLDQGQAADEDSVQKLLSEMCPTNLEFQPMKERLRGVIEDGVDAGVI